MFKTRKITASFFLALVLLISLNTIVSAQEEAEITAYPGQTIRNNKLYFKNTGVYAFYDAYAVASGPAADWVSPTTIYFGYVGGLETVTKTFTIEVPEETTLGDYSVIWEYYSERGYEGSVHITIHVTSQPWIPWIWIAIILAVVLAIAIPGIVIAVVVSRKKKRPPPPPEVIPPETTESGEV